MFSARWLYIIWHKLMCVSCKRHQASIWKPTHELVLALVRREAVPIRATDKFWNLKLRRWGKWEIEFPCAARVRSLLVASLYSWWWDAALQEMFALMGCTWGASIFCWWHTLAACWPGNFTFLYRSSEAPLRCDSLLAGNRFASRWEHQMNF